MDILSTNNDPYSCALPELARVTHTHLELNVDFEHKVLKGKAILTIMKEWSDAQTVFLDSCNLDIKKVTDYNTGSPLCYDIGPNCSRGSIFKIKLPKIKHVKCKIEIEYQTSEHSRALIWLTPEQTADGKYPFLLSNPKYTYARAMFPCQDTPSVKNQYSAKISTPKNFSVIMSATLIVIIETQDQVTHKFVQRSLTPAYGVFIAVGSLKEAKLGPRSIVFAESKFIDESRTMFENFESMLQIADHLCGFSLENQNICVLPPTISPKYFTVQCLNVIFVSPSLLRGDIYLVSSLAQQISHLWTEYIVVNYDHMWLNKSIGMFICKKFINNMPIDEEKKEFLRMKMDRKLVKSWTEGYKDIGRLQSLIPRLRNISPNYLMECVPYEVGCMLLEQLEHELELPSVFGYLKYLKIYFHTFLYKSINTHDWIISLIDHGVNFCKKEKMITSFDWSIYFFCTEPLIPDISITALETACSNLAEEWIRLDDNAEDIPRKFVDVNSYSDIEKREFLKYLFDSSVDLTVIKMNLMSNYFESHSQSYEIRFRWIRLCIKNRWEPIVDTALNFATHFSTPKYACSIFKDLYDWKKIRLITIETYIRNQKKFFHETQEKINSILHLNIDINNQIPFPFYKV
ncbi:leukotriene A-4 hydrolase-like [Temnothorax curvispinosus]|uniref:Leukotriene A-4 hydrolase-like n=1 Tax=Temnothorax curvispinosus TaxID=300111 RepID=A0A6J1RE61_9HYME|nr:leukotriene A-4 hydrolase-like [Temnothorax curvispinosus]